MNLCFDLHGIEADFLIFSLVFTFLCYVWSLIRRRKEIDFNVGNKTDPFFFLLPDENVRIFLLERS